MYTKTSVCHKNGRIVNSIWKVQGTAFHNNALYFAFSHILRIQDVIDPREKKTKTPRTTAELPLCAVANHMFSGYINAKTPCEMLNKEIRE